jgi:hypothetical protein
MSIQLGKYKHYKGQFYEVIGVALHSETKEELVVYKMLYETQDHTYGSLWVRPKEMFLEKILVEDKEITRFMFINE